MLDQLGLCILEPQQRRIRDFARCDITAGLLAHQPAVAFHIENIIGNLKSNTQMAAVYIQ